MEVCDRYDIAVDPIDGTKLTISGRPGAISTMALAHENGFYTTKAHYSLKLACGRRLADHLHLLDPIEETVRIARNKLGKNITVCVLDRPRHRGLILKLREMGVLIRLIQDGDIEGAISSCAWESGMGDSGVDIYYGIGGAPEAVIAAAAVKCLGGGFQAADWWNLPDYLDVRDLPVEKLKVLGMDELVRSHCSFIATGITDGPMLKGVRQSRFGFKTQSLLMRSSSGTFRKWITHHGN